MSAISRNRTHRAPIKQQSYNSFLVPYLTVIIIVLGFFIYLTSAEELKTKDAIGRWQNIKLAFLKSARMNTNSNFLAPTIDQSLRQLITLQTENKLQFTLNTDDIFEPENDQIKPKAISLLSQITAVSQKYQTLISSDLTFAIQPELSPQHYRETALALNRTHALQRFFMEKLSSTALVNSSIHPVIKAENKNNVTFLAVTLEI